MLFSVFFDMDEGYGKGIPFLGKRAFRGFPLILVPLQHQIRNGQIPNHNLLMCYLNKICMLIHFRNSFHLRIMLYLTSKKITGLQCYDLNLRIPYMKRKIKVIFFCSSFFQGLGNTCGSARWAKRGIDSDSYHILFYQLKTQIV